MKASSKALMRELEEAEKEQDLIMLLDLDPEEQEQAFFAAGAEAWEKLDALALEDPLEATRIFRAAKLENEEAIFPGEVYLAHGCIVEKGLLKELDTPEKRAAYIEDWNNS